MKMNFIPKTPIFIRWTKARALILGLLLIITVVMFAVEVRNAYASNSTYIKTTTVTYQVNTSAHDVYYDSTNGVFDQDGSSMYLIRSTRDIFTGFTFANVTIPSNATITEAYLSFASSNWVTNVYDSGYTVTCYPSDDYVSGNNMTLANVYDVEYGVFVNLDLIGVNNTNIWYQVEQNIASVLEEYRESKNLNETDNYAVVLLGASSYRLRNIITYDGNSSLAPKITITYTQRMPTNTAGQFVTDYRGYEIYSGSVGFSGFIISGQSFSGWELFYIDQDYIIGDYDDASYAINNFTNPVGSYMTYDGYGNVKGLVYDNKLFIAAMDGSAADDNVDLYYCNLTSDGKPTGSWDNVATLDGDRGDDWVVGYYNHTLHYVGVDTGGIQYRNCSLIDYSTSSLTTIYTGLGGYASHGCDILIEDDGGIHVVGSVPSTGSSNRIVRYLYLPPDRSSWSTSVNIKGTETMSYYPHIVDWNGKLIVTYDDGTSHVEYVTSDNGGQASWSASSAIANAGYSARELHYVPTDERLHLQFVHDELVDKRQAYSTIQTDWSVITAQSREPWANLTGVDCEGSFAINYNDGNSGTDYYYFWINYNADALYGWSDGMYSHWTSMGYWTGVKSGASLRAIENANSQSDGMPNNPTSAFDIISTLEGRYYVYNNGTLVFTTETLPKAKDLIDNLILDQMDSWIDSNLNLILAFIGYLVLIFGIGSGVSMMASGDPSGLNIIIVSFALGVGLLFMLLG